MGRKARTLDLNQAESILEDQRVQSLFDQYLAGWAALDPEGASAVGLHEFDFKVTPRSDPNRRALQSLYADFQRRLQDETNEDDLDRMGELRYRALLAELQGRSRLHALRDDRKLVPQSYLLSRAVLGLIEPDSGGLRVDRVRAAIARLEAWDGIIRQAKTALTRPPRLWTEAAIRQTEGTLAALEAVPAMVQDTFEISADIEPNLKHALGVASDALRGYKVFLSTAVLPRSDGKFAAGEEAYDALLRERHLLKVSNYKVLRLAEKSMKTAVKDLKRAARELDRKAPWQQVLELALSTGVPTAGLRTTYQREVEAARSHFERQAAFTIPADAIKVHDTPGDRRDLYPVWDYRPQGPLDTLTEGYFSVTPLDPTSPEAERARLAAWGHSRALVQGAVAQGVYPGLHVLQAGSRRAPTLLQRSLESPLLTQGWALYAEQFARETGYYASAAAKLVSLRTLLVAAGRAIVDVRLHCGDWDAAKAQAYLEKNVFMTPVEARAEVLRASLAPTEGMSGFIGLEAILALRKRMERKLGDQFTLREFHDRLLAYGRVPPSLIERHMTKTWLKK